MRALALAAAVLALAACAGHRESSPPPIAPSLDDMREKANIAWQYGDFGAALENFLRILRQEPENHDALLGAGEALLSLGNARQALPYFEAVLKKDGTDIDALEGRGLARLGIGKHDEARTAFEAVLAKDGKRWRSMNGLGTIADMAASYAEAAAWYEKALALAPEESTLYNNYGYSRIMARDYARAEDLLDRGVGLSPHSSRIITNLSLAIAWQGDYERAMRTAVQVQKDFVAYNDIGYIALLRHDYGVAIHYFQQALEKSPSWFARAANNLERAKRERTAQQAP